MQFDRILSRRAIMRGLAGGAVGIVALPLLSACNDEEEPTPQPAAQATPTAETDTAAEETPEGTPEDDATPEATPEDEPTEEPAATTGSLTVYSGRNENLIGPLMEQFEAATGITVQVRYGDTAELAAAILEEGQNSPADVFFAQDAGALGALAQEDILRELSSSTLDMVEERFRSPEDVWVGVSGRARAVVYNTENLSEADIPESILDFTDPQWRGRLGWAPTNASFQAFVTALRVIEGEDVAREWLEGLLANDIRTYEKNTPIVRAAIAGEIDAGFVNHYYLHRERAEAGGEVPAENYLYRNGDPGALINVAGAAILESAENIEQAETFVEYLLSAEAQQYFANETYEYPLVPGVTPDPNLVPLDEIQTPDIDLSDLADLEGTLRLLQEVGAL